MGNGSTVVCDTLRLSFFDFLQVRHH